MLDETRPDCVFIGVPPSTTSLDPVSNIFIDSHGGLSKGSDIELECMRRNIHMFIEKPISCYPIEQVEALATALDRATEGGLIISVGYMFRYAKVNSLLKATDSKAVLKIKSLIEEFGPPKAFNARYNCAYSTITKEMWCKSYSNDIPTLKGDTEASGGPIIEQVSPCIQRVWFHCK